MEQKYLEIGGLLEKENALDVFSKKSFHVKILVSRDQLKDAVEWLMVLYEKKLPSKSLQPIIISYQLHRTERDFNIGGYEKEKYHQELNDIVSRILNLIDQFNKLPSEVIY